MNKYSFVPTMQNEGGRKIILMDQMNHARRLQKVKSALDTRPPQSIKMKRRRVRGTTSSNPDPSAWRSPILRPHSRSHVRSPTITSQDGNGTRENSFVNFRNDRNNYEHVLHEAESPEYRNDVLQRTSPYEQVPFQLPVRASTSLQYNRPMENRDNTRNRANDKWVAEEESLLPLRKHTQSSLGFIEGGNRIRNYELQLAATRQTYVKANRTLRQKQQQRLRVKRQNQIGVDIRPSVLESPMKETKMQDFGFVAGYEQLQRSVPVRNGIYSPNSKEMQYEKSLGDNYVSNSGVRHRAFSFSDKEDGEVNKIIHSTRSLFSTTTMDSDIERFLMREDDALSVRHKYAGHLDVRIFDAFVDMLVDNKELSGRMPLQDILSSVKREVEERALLRNYSNQLSIPNDDAQETESKRNQYGVIDSGPGRKDQKVDKGEVYDVEGKREGQVNNDDGEGKQDSFKERYTSEGRVLIDLDGQAQILGRNESKATEDEIQETPIQEADLLDEDKDM